MRGVAARARSVRYGAEAVRICFFGDSFVNGTGDDDALGWGGSWPRRGGAVAT